MNKTTILIGDCRKRLAELPDKSVHCIVTSPPYWGLRSYHLATWEGGDPECEHEGKPLGRGEHRTVEGAWDRPSRMAVPRQPVCMKCGAIEVKQDGGIGLEPTWQEHLNNLMQVFDECWRVLRDDGAVFLNYGDAYVKAQGVNKDNSPRLPIVPTMTYKNPGPKSNPNEPSSWSSRHQKGMRPTRNNLQGWKPKDLMMMPARVAIEMQERGWYLRSEIVWAKKNPMPESVTDRPTSAHEKVFLLTKKPKYFYDHVAVRVPYQPASLADKRTRADGRRKERDPVQAPDMSSTNLGENKHGGANMRNVWNLSTESFREAHFATFPTKLVEPCIKAGTSEHGACGACGKPWVRETSSRLEKQYESRHGGRAYGGESLKATWTPGTNVVTTTGWAPTCECNAETAPAVVLDPFGGSGTVGVVAGRLGRDSIIIEISEEYADIAEKRIVDDCPLLNQVEVK